jgi:hypothetical protein
MDTPQVESVDPPVPVMMHWVSAVEGRMRRNIAHLTLLLEKVVDICVIAASDEVVTVSVVALLVPRATVIRIQSLDFMLVG